MAKTLAVANQKGGVGKTTTVVNLAAYVAQAGRRSLIVDLDPQANATSSYGIKEDDIFKSTYDVLTAQCPAADAIKPTDIPLLDLIPSTTDLAGAEVELVPAIAREMKLRTALSPIQKNYDFIFIDCPPSLGILTLNAFCASTRVLSPIQCEYYALEGLTNLMETIRTVRRQINPELEIEGIVMTMFDRRTNLSTSVVEEVKKFFKDKVYDVAIPRNVKLSEAPSFGQPIALYDPKCNGAHAYYDLAQEFLAANPKH